MADVSGFTAGRRRLVAERFRRIWAVVQSIADEPGQSRAGLAERFYLSERQIQSDLTVIQDVLGLPLIRQQGYRFAGQGAAGSALGVRDVMLLATLMTAHRPGSMAEGPLLELALRLPDLFPAHLRPLARLLLEPLGTRRQVCASLVTAILDGSVVRLHYPPGIMAPFAERSPMVRPELLLPVLGDWYLLARWDHGQTRMLPLAAVESVSWVPRESQPPCLRAAS